MKSLSHINTAFLLIGSSLLLVACGVIDRMSSLHNDPIMKVRYGMSKSEVIQVMGSPIREVSLRQSDNICLDYTTVTKKEHEFINHAIVFNNENRVSDIYTFSNCYKLTRKVS